MSVLHPLVISQYMLMFGCGHIRYCVYLSLAGTIPLHTQAPPTMQAPGSLGRPQQCSANTAALQRRVLPRASLPAVLQALELQGLARAARSKWGGGGGVSVCGVCGLSVPTLQFQMYMQMKPPSPHSI